LVGFPFVAERRELDRSIVRMGSSMHVGEASNDKLEG